MSHQQGHIAIHEHYLMFKGPMQLNYKFNVQAFLCHGDVSICTMELFLNVFNEFAEFVITVKGFKPATSCVTTAPARHVW